MLIQDSTLKMIVDGIYTVEAVARTHRTHPQKVREALTDYKQRQATLDHLASLQDRDAAPTQKHILDGLNDCVKILENVSTSVSERLEAAFAVPEVERADESARAEAQHITDLRQIQALFDAWGVKLEPCNTLGGYLVKGTGDDTFFLTETTIETIITLRKAKVETSRIKEVIEKAGVDFNLLTKATDTPLTLETQLQKAVFEAVQSVLA